MLQELSGQSDYKFNPSGFVTDEHHANRRSINIVFRTSGQSMVSCEFHFQQCVHRHDDWLTIQQSLFACPVLGWTRKLNKDLIKQALTLTNCKHVIHICIVGPIRGRTENIHFPAFKPRDAPSMNLAKVGHSKLNNTGWQNILLLEATTEDVALVIRQKLDLQCFNDGLTAGGRVLTSMQWRSKMLRLICNVQQHLVRSYNKSFCHLNDQYHLFPWRDYIVHMALTNRIDFAF